MDDIAKWQLMGCSIGLNGTRYPAWDGDISNRDRARTVHALIVRICGDTPVRFGRHPRFLLPYSAVEGQPIRWRKVEWELPDGTKEHLEIRGDGQQYVVAGEHPGTGKLYAWPQGVTPAAEWRVLTLELVQQVFAELEKLVQGWGGVVVVTAASTGEGRAVADQATLMAPSAEALQEAMAVLPNQCASRVEWITGLAAIRAASQGLLDDDGQELAWAWCERWEGGSDTESDWQKAWASLRPPYSVGWSWIEERARGNGWIGSAKLAFAGVDAPVLQGGSPGQSDATSGVVAEAVKAMNAEHICVLVGTNTRIARHYCDENGHAIWRFVPPRELQAFYDSRLIQLPSGRHLNRVAVWMKAAERRTADGITFAPGEPEMVGNSLNLWRGWGVQPSEAGSCERFRSHLLEVVCGGDRGVFRYLWGWLADLVQNAARKPEVAVVLRGGKGTGKSIVGDYLMPILGPARVVVSQKEHFVGRFNASLRGALLVQVEEAFWAGDKAAEGALKHLITAPEITLELKGVDPVPIRSCARFLFTSNEEWVVPATSDERRYLVLDVSSARRGDRQYFSDLLAERDGGGAAHLLWELQHEDLSAFDVRTVPRTDALADQILESLPPAPRCWFEFLMRGYITDRQRIYQRTTGGANTVVDQGTEWVPVVRRDLFAEAVAECARQHRWTGHLPTENSLLRQLRPYLPKSFRSEGQRLIMPPPRGSDMAADNSRKWTYLIPALTECRAAFELQIGRKISWHDDEAG
ncbi:DUF5906 domain-containing protein [Roseomonas sp. BN140053]|uniref:DUF5906 domain-containing protein n=1 Tax=Roseomonas sp. BN140053 TaxID=3391898 RepID=UPI0039EADB91